MLVDKGAFLSVRAEQHSAGVYHSLQWLRAVAALAVVHAHAIGEWEALTRTPIRHGWHIGTAGVDVFFVISGFIIARTAVVSPSAGAFFLRRWQRVAPLYWLATPLALPFVPIGDWLERARVTLTFWPVGDGHQIVPLLAPGWTLGFEMLFYTAVAFTVGRPRIWTAIVVALALLVTAQTLGHSQVLDFVGNPILIEFVFGASIAWLWRRPRPVLGMIALGVAAFGFTLGAQVAWLHDGHYAMRGESSWLRVAIFGLSAWALVWGGAAVGAKVPVQVRPSRQCVLFALLDSPPPVVCANICLANVEFAGRPLCFCWADLRCRCGRRNPSVGRDPLARSITQAPRRCGSLVSWLSASDHQWLIAAA